MRSLLLLPIFLAFASPKIATGESININLCWKYKSDGINLENSTENCNYYFTGYESIEDSEMIKDEAYESCTEKLGAFNYTQSEKTSLKKGATTEYKYYCQTNT